MIQKRKGKYRSKIKNGQQNTTQQNKEINIRGVPEAAPLLTPVVLLLSKIQ